jgi:polyhydroxyalkanoate synthesis regulator phasin
MKRTWWIAGAGALVAAAVIGAGAVMAQSGGSSSGTPTFLDRVAQKLGIDTPKLQDAVKSAAHDEIDARVASGELTQQQADRLKQKIDQSNGDELVPFGRGFERGMKEHMGAGVNAQALADFLGVSTDELRTELRADNATLASVAQAHGKSRDDLKAFIKDSAKRKLDQAVADGKLTQDREDAILQGLDSHLDAIVDGRFPGAFHKGMGGHMRPDDGPEAAPSPGAGGARLRSVLPG